MVKHVAERVSRLATVAVILGATIVLSSGTAHAVSTRVVSGTVRCMSGRSVVQVAVTSSNGNGGSAGLWRAAGHPDLAYYRYRFSTTTAETLVGLRVGCGGTRSAPRSLNVSVRRTVVRGNRVLNARCYDSTDECRWPPQGTVAAEPQGNWGDPGQCTYGALELWEDRAGHYPFWGGDAGAWDENARANGWFVSKVPHARAVVVFEASSQYGAVGHVGYVLGITPLRNGAFDVRVREMNYPRGTGFAERTVRHGAGMSYIVSTI